MTKTEAAACRLASDILQYLRDRIAIPGQILKTKMKN